LLLPLGAMPAAFAEDSPGPDELTLSEALAIARSLDDPMLERFMARAEALEDSAVAEAQLPDPMITAQVANVPVESFRFDRDGMTQALRVGVRQEFPAGRTLAVRGQQRQAEAGIERRRRAQAMRDLELETHTAWLDLAWHLAAGRILIESRAAVAEQIESLSSRFATGRMHSQDMLRAELELSLIDDQLVEHQRGAEVARAALSRYIGRHAHRPLPERAPALGTPAARAELERRLLEHPAVRVEHARIERADLGVELAEQAYKPRFALEGGYGVRDGRSDLASIGVTLSLPLFTDKRQDRQRSAAVRQRGAAELELDTLLLEYRRRLEQDLAHFNRLTERVDLYAEALAERARQTAEAAVTTYASGQTDFAELIRAQLAELQIQLKRAELEFEAARAWARLVWLTGDPA
ncbi:MAG: TolC family protein, partial [Wenzhouxiangellaceae bacterium]